MKSKDKDKMVFNEPKKSTPKNPKHNTTKETKIKNKLNSLHLSSRSTHLTLSAGVLHKKFSNAKKSTG